MNARVIAILRSRAWAPFLVSRGLIAFVAICLTPTVTQPQSFVPMPALTEWPNLLNHVLFVADSGYYLFTAVVGYTPGPFSADAQANWAFFPAYPLLIKGLSAVLPLDPAWLGIIASNVLLMAGLLVLRDTVIATWGEAATDTSIWLLALYPMSYFLSGFRPEALFLLFSVLVYREAGRGHWWSAGLLGALASATRPQGVLVAIFIVVEAWQLYRWQWRRWLPVGLAVALTGLGLAAFMVYLRMLTGSALAFLHIQAAWSHAFMVPGWPFLDFARGPYLLSHGGWDLGVVNLPLTLLALGAGVVLLVSRSYSLALYTLANVLVFVANNTLEADGRYVAVLFPVFLVVGRWLTQEGRSWREGTLATSAGLLAALTLLVTLDVRAPQS